MADGTELEGLVLVCGYHVDVAVEAQSSLRWKWNGSGSGSGMGLGFGGGVTKADRWLRLSACHLQLLPNQPNQTTNLLLFIFIFCQRYSTNGYNNYRLCRVPGHIFLPLRRMHFVLMYVLTECSLTILSDGSGWDDMDNG